MFERFIFKISRTCATTQKERRDFVRKLNDLHLPCVGKIEPTVRSICGRWHSDIFNTESTESVERIKKLFTFLKENTPSGFKVEGFVVKEWDFANLETSKECPFERARKYAIEELS